MPIFEYKCEDCGNRFEKLIRRDTQEPEPVCPACGKPHPPRQLSTFAAHSAGGSSKELPMCPNGGVCRTPGACGLN